MTVRASVRNKREMLCLSEPKDVSDMLISYRVPMTEYRVKALAEINTKNNRSMQITENLANSQHFMRRSLQAKHNDFPLVEMNKAKNPHMNVTTSMGKWNAKINPKLGKDKSEIPVNSRKLTSSPQFEDYKTQKPATARTTSRNGNLRPSLISKQTQNTFRSTQ